MADQPNNDDTSFVSRETDDEKSLASREEMYTTMMKKGSGDNKDKKGDKEQDESRSASASKDDDAGGGGKDDTKSNKDTANDGTTTTEGIDEQEEKERRTAKKNLNEPTLNALETCLRSGDFFNEPLEYEEVAAFTLKIHRYADEKTRMRQGLLLPENETAKADDVEERMYNQVYQEEEFHAVGNEFFKTVQNEASELAGPSFIMHNKTCNWLKRAAGLQRNYDPYNNQQPTQELGLSEESEEEGADSAAVEGAPRRLTRTRVRMTRKKRRQEKLQKETEGLRLLADVARELKKGQTKRLAAIERQRRKERKERSRANAMSMEYIAEETEKKKKKKYST